VRAQLFRLWLPPLIWTAVILLLSSDLASSGNTGDFLRQLLPALTDQEFAVAHFAIRKASHLVEYAILGALNFRAVRAGRAGWSWRWAVAAAALAAGVAILDESRQTLTSSRTGSGWDVLIDAAGATIAQLLTRLRYSLQRT
jgi:VanZ family protein